MKKSVLGLFLLLIWNLSAWADVPKYISFQGELTDSQGTRITSSKSVTFKLHSAASGGAILWSEAQTLTPANGIVSAIVGNATTGGVSLAFDTQYWLGVTVSPDAEMSPRIRLTTSPYAFIAKFLDTGATAYGALSVAETVTANKFVGNGSLLTGITASGAADTDWTIATASAIYRLSGNVGIGTTSPTDSLHVVGPMRVMQVNEAGTFVIDNSGNVGIGIAVPLDRLTVRGGGITIPDNQYLYAANAGTLMLGDDDNVNLSQGNLYVQNTTGNVGIGNTSPGAKLHVTGDVSVSDSLVVGDTRLVVLKSGNVGIGTTSPAKALHVRSPGGTIRLDESANTGYYTDLNYMGPTLFSASGSANNYVIATNNQEWASGGGGIVFSPKQTEAMRITSGGNVGIGTTSPGDSLHVAGRIQMDTNAASTAADGAIRWSGSDFEGRKAGSWVSLTSTGGADTDWTITATDVYRTTGKVGIGTTAPSDSLHVAGTVRVSDSMTVGDTVFVVNSKSGNVGIGTTAPGVPLDIRTADGTTQIRTLGNAGNSRFTIGTDASANVLLRSNNAVDLRIGVGADNMVIKDGGNVGIGTTSPTRTVDITGTMRLSTGTFYTPATFLGVYNDGGGAQNVKVGSLEVTSLGYGGANLAVGDVYVSGKMGIGDTAPGAKLRVAGDVSVSDSLVVGDTRLVVLKSGNVGIGTTGPGANLEVADRGAGDDAQPKLKVGNGAVTNATVNIISNDGSNSFQVFDDGVLGTPLFLVQRGGNVGIGSASPGARLDVAGGARFSDSVVVSDTVLVVLKSSGNVGIGTTAPASKLDVAGTVTATSFSGSGSGLTGVAASSLSPANLTAAISTDSIANGSVTSAKLAGSIKVSDSFVVGSDSLVVTTSGNVGIGTTAPNRILQIHDSTNNQMIQFTGAATGSTISDGTQVGGAGNIDFQIFNSESGFLRFGTSNAERMRIDSSGNVGIGDTSPGAKLRVAGDVSVSDSLVVGDTRLVVLKSGNVGIGSTAPGGKLDVAGSVLVSDSLAVGDTRLVVLKNGSVGIGTASVVSTTTLDLDQTDQNAIMFSEAGASRATLGVAGGANDIFTGTADNDMAIRSESNLYVGTGGNNIRMLISGTTGNVGIGTTSPGDSLHVSGRIQMDTNAAATAADGAIRWSGSDFEGRKAGSWVSLTSTGGADTDWTITATDVYRTSGKVGIGTTAPSDSLHVAGTVRVSDSMTVGDTVFVVNSKSGYVGIGTTAPANPLHIRRGWNGTTTGAQIHLDASGDGVDGFTAIDMRRFSTAFSGGLQFYTGSESFADGIVRMEQGTRDMTFLTGPGSGVPSVKMTIANGGNVGIGSTTPGTRLDVSGGAHVSDSFAVGGPAGDSLVVLRSGNVGIGTTSPQAPLWIYSATPNASAGMVHIRAATGQKNYITFTEDAVRDEGAIGFDNGGSTMNFYTGGVLNNGSVKMAITSNGNVGIGSTAPGGKLHVAGNVIVKDTFTVKDTVFVVKENGYVGIGTAGPTQMLHIHGTGGISPAISMTSATAGMRTFDLYRPDGTTRVDFNDAGVKTVMSLDLNSGNVGIGNTTPGAKLHVTGDVSVSDSLVVGDTRLVVLKSGNVGIGTTSPASKLDVVGTVTATSFSGSGAGLTGVSASSVAPANLTAQISTDSIAANAVTGAKLAGSLSARDSFVVGSDSLVVATSGKVAIGITSPGRLLTVGANGVNDYVRIASNVQSGFELYDFSQAARWSISRPVSGTQSNALVIRDAGNSVDRAVFNYGATADIILNPTNGNVGIGDTSPGAKLRVAGDVSVSDSLVVGDTRLVVLKSGNVGIGTAAPSQDLHIYSSDEPYIFIERGVAGTQMGLQFRESGSIKWSQYVQSSSNDLRFYDETDRVTFQAGGNVGIGTTIPGAKLHVAGNIIVKDTMTVGDTFLVVLASGRVGIGTASPDTDFSVNGGASKVGGGSWATFSDGRLKNIDGKFTAGAAELMKLNPVKYRYKKDNPVGIKDGAEHVGLVAQEVKEAIPEAVESNNKGYLMLNNDPIIFAMLNAIKEQKAENDTLKADNADLKAAYTELSAMVAELKAQVNGATQK